MNRGCPNDRKEKKSMKHREIVSITALEGQALIFGGLIYMKCVAMALLWKINVPTLQNTEEKTYFS